MAARIGTMSNRNYLCTKCGTLRRAGAIYLPHRRTWGEMKASAFWPKHCGLPTKALTFEQGVAATHMECPQRVRWAEGSLHIIQRGGKRKWMPALNARQIVEAKQQFAAFRERQSQG